MRNEKKIFIYFNEKKYLYYSNSSPPIRIFDLFKNFPENNLIYQLLQVGSGSVESNGSGSPKSNGSGSGSPKINGSDRIRILIPGIKFLIIYIKLNKEVRTLYTLNCQDISFCKDKNHVCTRRKK